MNNDKDEMSKPPTTVYPPEQPQTDLPVEHLTASSRTVIAICGAVAVAIIGWVTIRADIASNNKDLTALSKKVDRIEENLKAFDRLSDIQREINDLKKNGSDNLQNVKTELDKLREAFRIHLANSKEKDPFQ